MEVIGETFYAIFAFILRYLLFHFTQPSLLSFHCLLCLTFILFPPQVNPKRLENGLNVIQLETAVGSAIHNFEGAIGWLHTGSKL